MKYEVELKFRVANLESVEAQLRHLGAQLHPVVEQVDSYFAHPARDFAATDEALRIRRVREDNYITYKGPKIDAATKTRREIELPLATGLATCEQFGELLMALGFRRVADVRKKRRTADVLWRGQHIEVALDQVDRVGEFVELELQAAPSAVEAAKQLLADLAEQLQLSGNERRSYLELLLQSQSNSE
jgi:adenylate cyclase class 2